MVDDASGNPIFTIGIAGETLEALIEFCYTEKIRIDGNNVVEILEAASMLQFELVHQMCAQHLQENLKISNCLSVWLIAQHYDLEDLVEQALELAMWSFRKVVKEDEFFQMNSEPLVTFLSQGNINTRSEEDIFEAMIAWIQFDEPAQDRKCSFSALIKTVRLCYLKTSVSSTSRWF